MSVALARIVEERERADWWRVKPTKPALMTDAEIADYLKATHKRVRQGAYAAAAARNLNRRPR